MKIPITGFEPFGARTINSSWVVAEKVATQGVLGVDVVAERLPVSFLNVAESLRRIVVKHNPDIVLLLGQTSLCNYIKLERVALNMMDSKLGDNDGFMPDEEIIYPGEDMARLTTLPIKRLHASVNAKGIAAKISNSCGLYVCNRTYYEALKLCGEHGHCRAMFIHLPLCEEQHSELTMSTSDMITAIETIINELYYE